MSKVNTTPKAPRPQDGMMKHIEFLKSIGYTYDEMERMWMRSIRQAKSMK